MQPSSISNSRNLFIVFAVLIIIVGLVLGVVVANSPRPTSYQMTASAVVNTNIRPIGLGYDTATAAAETQAAIAVETEQAGK